MLIHGTKYEGLENIPEEGGVILAGNHTGNTDALRMLGGPKRIVHMMAKKELFKTKFTNAYFRSMACISVDRSIHDENAKSEAIEVLKNGNILGIFPEGTVNKTNEILLPFKYGAVSFAKKTGAYIVPFAITGSYSIFKRNIKLTYGKAYKVTGDLESENKKLMKKVSDLIKKGRE
jgi:1-acyl-sn-glycerol-3-phosphate acyltransferase